MTESYFNGATFAAGHIATYGITDGVRAILSLESRCVVVLPPTATPKEQDDAARKLAYFKGAVDAALIAASEPQE